jgi:4-hydroxy-tetrahydrodipicolinate synthase
MTELARRANQGDFAGARELQKRYLPVMQANFVESNPGPVKWAMHRMGLLDPVWRLPMVPPTDASKRKIEQAMADAGLIAVAEAA